MNLKLTLLALVIAGLAFDTRAVTNPVVVCATTTLYANVTDPFKLAFAPDGTLYVGRDNVGSGGTHGDAVKIHRVAPGGSPVTEYGNVAIADPDAVGFDALGIVSGTPGAVLVGSATSGLGATISKINTNGVVTTLFGGIQTNMANPGELFEKVRAIKDFWLTASLLSSECGDADQTFQPSFRFEAVMRE